MCHLCEIAEKKVISLDEQKDRSNDLLNFLTEEVRFVKEMKQFEVIGGNIVKEALWQGELIALGKVITHLHHTCGDDTYTKLIEEI